MGRRAVSGDLKRRRWERLTLEAQTYLSERLDQPPTIPAIARHLGININTLQVAFHAVTGVSIATYGRNLRLEKAAKLLLETDGTLEEVAGACGYLERAAFSVAFVKKYEKRPGQWRQEHRSSKDIS